MKHVKVIHGTMGKSPILSPLLAGSSQSNICRQWLAFTLSRSKSYSLLNLIGISSFGHLPESKVPEASVQDFGGRTSTSILSSTASENRLRISFACQKIVGAGMLVEEMNSDRYSF